MKAKIITLKDYDLSKTVANDCINQAVKFGIEVSIFDAVNGLFVDSCLKNFGIRPRKKIRPGALGCCLSHISLWKSCVEENVPYLILTNNLGEING